MQSQNKIILFILLCVLLVQPNVTKGEASKVSPISGLEKKISLDLRSIDILDLFKFISQKGGLNLVVDSGIGGKIALFLKDVTIREVLDIAVRSTKLAYALDNGIIKVMSEEKYQSYYGKKFQDNRSVKSIKLKNARPKDVISVLEKFKSKIGNIVIDSGSKTVVIMDTPENIKKIEDTIRMIDNPMKLKIFPIMYADPKYVLDSIKDQLSEDIGMAKLDDRTGRIIIKDYPIVLKDIGRLIKSFDKKDKQVLIEAKIVQVRLTDKFEMGINWDSLLPKTKALEYIGSFPASGISNVFQKFSIGKLEEDDFNVAIQLLRTIGDTELISSPRITVINNHEAKIHVGTTDHYFESTTTSNQSGNLTASIPKFIDVGVKFSVTPRINDNGFISMKIAPEISSVTDKSDGVPVIEKSEVETKVIIKEGVTILIAGLIKNDTITVVSKTPVLGDIPFLGTFFRSEKEEKIKTEIVVFITPHIITGEENIFAVEDTAKKRKPRKELDIEFKNRKKRKSLNEKI